MTFNEAVQAILDGKEVRLSYWPNANKKVLMRGNSIMTTFNNIDYYDSSFTGIEILSDKWEIYYRTYSFTEILPFFLEGRKIKRLGRPGWIVRPKIVGSYLPIYPWYMNNAPYTFNITDFEATDWTLLED